MSYGLKIPHEAPDYKIHSDFIASQISAIMGDFNYDWQQQEIHPHIIDVFYGDESRVSLLPCVPYGWQFAGEQVTMLSELVRRCVLAQ